MTDTKQANVVPLKAKASKKAVKTTKPKAKKATKTVAKKATVTTKSEKTKVAAKTAKAITQPKKAVSKKITAKKKPTNKKPAVKKAKAAKPAPKKAVKKATKKTTKKTAAKAALKTVKAKAKPQKKVAKKVTKKVAKKIAAKPTPKAQTLKKETIMNPQNFDFTKISQDAANASRENVEAFIKSGTIFAKGFEELMKTAAALTQTAAEKQAQFAKEVMSSKTLNEFTEAQNKVTQASFNELMVNTTKLSEMSVKLLSEASEPLNKAMTKTMNAAQKQAA